ncbi:MAG: glutamate formimidoyltransferase [Euryarchaeota archaeon]|nr:glutamate formimidoyltransferase [Euryarchaeota archaeon]|tara:strand:- start:1483 stop:2523 length:1041 start_codon:yes stop_codon:yes gene_type:complete
MDDVLIECVPNFSEGRNKNTIEAIKDAILSTPNVTLLDIDVGRDFNRTVITMVGNPSSILTAAVKSSKVAFELIDMQNHTGEHARMGAVDVVPFIPLANASMEICTTIAIKYAEIISTECDVPVYLYGESATKLDRISLPNIRRGEFEGFSEKIKQKNWIPDYGKPELNKKSGVTATGSRNMLIAYNVNLDTNDKALANIIAGKIRTSGVLKKDDEGNKIIGDNGKPKREPGKFKSLQAAGWMYDDDTAQVSMNLLNYNVTGFHHVMESIKLEAKKLGLNVISSELVGLCPLDAFLEAGRYYCSSDNITSQEELVDIAIKGLKLDVIDKFIPENNIIEWTIIKNRG